jgi:hypothetical protein
MCKRAVLALTLFSAVAAWGGISFNQTTIGEAVPVSPKTFNLMSLRSGGGGMKLSDLIVITNAATLSGRQESALVYDRYGNAYGATRSGGTYGLGLVYKIDTNNAVTTLRSLPSTNTSGEGYWAFGGVILINDDTLMGTTIAGSSNNLGGMFTIKTSGSGYKEVMAYYGTNGASPNDRLLFDGNQTVYSTTIQGGEAGDYGTIASHTTNGVANWIYKLHGTNGSHPYGGLIFNADRSRLVGTTSIGGANGYGVVFDISTNGNDYRALYHLTGGNNGHDPENALSLGIDGRYYGSTSGTNSYMFGGLFVINADGTGFNLFYRYSSATVAPWAFPQEPLRTRNGDFLVPSYYGGIHHTGNVLRFTTSLDVNTIVDFDGTNGGSMTTLVLNPFKGTYDGVRRQLGSPAIYRKVEISIPEMTQVNRIENSPSNNIISFDSAAGQTFTLLSGELPGVSLTNVVTVNATSAVTSITNNGPLVGNAGFRIITDFTNTPSGFNTAMAKGVYLPPVRSISYFPPVPPCTNCPPDTNGVPTVP